MTPGAWIHARRKAMGLKRYDLADLADMTQSRLHAIEDDGVRPSHGEAMRLAAALGDRWDVLADLLDGRTIRLCSNCGCHEMDACLDALHQPCGWAGPDLCTHCADPFHAILAFDAAAQPYVRLNGAGE